MKPQSIRRFDQFWWASVVISVLGLVLAWDPLVAQVQSTLVAGGRAASVGSAHTALMVSAGFSVMLAAGLWALISVLRIGAARWAVVLYVGYSLVTLPFQALQTGGMAPLAAASAANGLCAVIALYFLFRSDAKAWFAVRRAD